MNVEKLLNAKSPSQELRLVLFLLFTQKLGGKSTKTFDQFYSQAMKKIIADVRSQLNPEI